jgi:hypothetical protein
MLIRITVFAILLTTGLISCLAQPPAAAASVWNLSLPAGMVITSAVNVTNKCRDGVQLKLESKDLKFLILPDKPIDVAAERTIAVPVQFDTKALKPGKYEGALTITCVTCGGESGCPISKEERKVSLTVTPAMGGPQVTKAAEFDSKPVKNGEATAPMSRTVSPTFATLREFLKGPCPERERDCDSLRREAEVLAEQAKVLSAKVSGLQQTAAIARKAADALNSADKSQKALEIRQNASAAEVDATSAATAAAKSTEASEAALSEYKKCLVRVQEECRKKN